MEAGEQPKNQDIQVRRRLSGVHQIEAGTQLASSWLWSLKLEVKVAVPCVGHAVTKVVRLFVY